MSSAVNHRKRSHRSQRMHYQAARARKLMKPIKQAGHQLHLMDKGWLRRLFRTIGRQERGAEKGAAE